MSDDNCCGDTGGGGSCDSSAPCADTGTCVDTGTCSDTGTCIDTGPSETNITHAETPFSNGGVVCIVPPHDPGFCFGETTSQPVCSSSSRSNGSDRANQRDCIISTIIILAIFGICKLNTTALDFL